MRMLDDELLTTWRDELETARGEGDDRDESPVVHVAPTEAVLDIKFYAGYGGAEGPGVLIWTEQRVYFPVQYDGAEWLGSAPRNPTHEPQWHLGGG